MKKINYLKSARKTINLESDGLKRLAKSLNKDFSTLCEYLLNSRGRIICLGVGKSGHIANKTSATLSSTGSPAFFINAAEALHGDVGSITKKDSVIIFSHSGESDEVINLLPTLRDLKCNIFRQSIFSIWKGVFLIDLAERFSRKYTVIYFSHFIKTL